MVLVTGFTSRPSVSRSSRSQISFFANGRWVQNKFLTYALEEAYHALLPQGRHPIAVVNISLDPKLVDVNVHPAKAEVRFLNEREVFGAVQRSVRA
ncbi:MAG: DNA mismatch repair protein MutL, partial [Chloroflexi bacterium]|nr:DNA mismatch repair protein MutL [Chloroflexota bacterium]